MNFLKFLIFFFSWIFFNFLIFFFSLIVDSPGQQAVSDGGHIDYFSLKIRCCSRFQTSLKSEANEDHSEKKSLGLSSELFLAVYLK